MQFRIIAVLAGLAAFAQAAAIDGSKMPMKHDGSDMPMKHNGTMLEAQKAPMKAPMKTNTTMDVEKAGPVSATVVVTSIKKVTVVSHTANTILKAPTNPFTFPAVAYKGYTAIKSIVTFVTSDVTMLKGAPKATYSSGDQNLICSAFIDFVKVHQALLHTLIGRHALIAAVPLVGPFVAGVLREIEGGVDTLAFIIIGEVPTCASSAQKAQASLQATLKQSITVYSS